MCKILTIMLIISLDPSLCPSEEMCLFENEKCDVWSAEVSKINLPEMSFVEDKKCVIEIRKCLNENKKCSNEIKKCAITIKKCLLKLRSVYNEKWSFRAIVQKLMTFINYVWVSWKSRKFLSDGYVPPYKSTKWQGSRWEGKNGCNQMKSLHCNVLIYITRVKFKIRALRGKVNSRAAWVRGGVVENVRVNFRCSEQILPSSLTTHARFAV